MRLVLPVEGAAISADLSQVTVLCTAFGPQGHLERLTMSLRALPPAVRMLVAGPTAGEGSAVVKLPRGATEGFARNALLARVRTPLFALVNDELQLHRGAKLDAIAAPVAAGQLDVAAGDYIRCRKKLLVLTSREPAPGHGSFRQDRGALALVDGIAAAGDGFHVCHYAHHFFVGRTDKVRSMGGWDPQLSVGNELEFFVRAERFGVRVGLCPTVAAWHWGSPVAAGDMVSVEAVARMNFCQVTLPTGTVVAPQPARLAA